jgi:hypothetical protein
MSMELIFNFNQKHFFTLIILLIMIIACKEPKKTFIYKKPSFDSIGKVPYEKALKLYGKPYEEEIFNIKNGLGGPRYWLHEKYNGFPDLNILEAVWRKDSLIDIMIWYKKEKNSWQPMDTIMYTHGTDF